jgi:hypothetical protein
MKQPTQDQAINTAAAANPNVKTVTLETPLTRGDNLISSIEIRKPNVGTLRGLSLQSVLQWDVNSMSKLLPRITSPAISEPEIMKMDVSDFTALNIAVTGFLASAKSQVALMT